MRTTPDCNSLVQVCRPQTAPDCLKTAKRSPRSALKCISHIDPPVRMRGLETVSASPAQAKRHSVKDAIKNYRTYYRRRGPQADARRRHASKRQAMELAQPHPPGRAPGNTTSSYELRQTMEKLQAFKALLTSTWGYAVEKSRNSKGQGKVEKP